MKHKRLVLTPLNALLVLCLSGAGIIGAQEPDPPAGTGTIEVTITGMENHRGQLLINLFVSPDGFPSDPNKALKGTPLTIESDEVRVVFEQVPAGPFAIAAFHDKNANFKLDTNFLGMPSERWGVSRGARGRFGPPSFESARMTLEAGETVAVPIEVR